MFCWTNFDTSNKIVVFQSNALTWPKYYQFSYLDVEISTSSYEEVKHI